MTLLTFIKISCAAIAGIYLISVNMFQGNNKRTGQRPEPNSFTFFPKKNDGLSEEEFKRNVES
ncbi:hypothetical protein Runsl_5827 (plasmid) [Runella slithyformis DSM 19594]|uniref:Lipoxygenase domain-containing protein n=1 Tax=Runella slithyformis (strain ATCC 29530 / DSM 19594 / LMG 11500 / NCIMB 11436 / LSU 4) TaxID=761193 RepID=A0A7U4E987_RUNSL|nr:hypothetical protein Runsl_5827 [Runella slithyformis DSM 19594]